MDVELQGNGICIYDVLFTSGIMQQVFDEEGIEAMRKHLHSVWAREEAYDTSYEFVCERCQANARAWPNGFRHVLQWVFRKEPCSMVRMRRALR
jgi:hypothetical protein